MVVRKKDMICPICLKKMNKRHVRWICPKDRTEVIPSVKERLTGKAPICKNEGCGRQAYMTCVNSNSGKELPWDILKYNKNMRFSVIGLTGAGKTTFLTTMLEELRSSSDLWSAFPMDQDSKAWYKKNHDRLYEQHKQVDSTKRVEGDTILPLLLWKIQDLMKRNSRRTPTYTMTIFDGAGEDFAQLKEICRGDTPLGRYLYTSRVIVILVDPLGFPEVSANVDKEIRMRSMTANVDRKDNLEMIQDLVDVIKEKRGIHAEHLLDTYIAVVFTKLDVVENQFHTNSRVLQPSPHIRERGFVKSDADEVNSEIKNWLEKYHASDLIKTLEANFEAKKIRYFGVSSYGRAPRADQLAEITSRRILDPLIWMLSLEGVVPQI